MYHNKVTTDETSSMTRGLQRTHKIPVIFFKILSWPSFDTLAEGQLVPLLSQLSPLPQPPLLSGCQIQTTIHLPWSPQSQALDNQGQPLCLRAQWNYSTQLVRLHVLPRPFLPAETLFFPLSLCLVTHPSVDPEWPCMAWCSVQGTVSVTKLSHFLVSFSWPMSRLTIPYPR